MAIKFASALDSLPKKQAEVPENTGYDNQGADLSPILLKKEAAAQNLSTSLDDVVKNTVVLWHAWQRS